jgi:hypothetical protein
MTATGPVSWALGTAGASSVEVAPDWADELFPELPPPKNNTPASTIANPATRLTAINARFRFLL